MRDFHLPGRSPVFATNGMCATSHPLATAQAIDILKSGGNAVDAAIAGAVLLGICEPHMTGLGGDCFVLFTPPGSETVHGLNGSGRAPEGLDPDRLRRAGHGSVPTTGAASVTLPGAVDAFCQLSEDWGRLGLEACLAPAIRYAEEGVPVAPRVAMDWAEAAGQLNPTAQRHYLTNGQVPSTGTLFRAPGQAEVLRRISKDGRAGFYEGDVAADMLSALTADGGPHSAEDFAATRCAYTEPVRGQYRGTELIEHPPNGQGATAILLANILAEFDLAALDPHGADRVHIEAEATKLAYDARDRFLSDADHMTRLDHMLDPATAKRLAALIDPDRAAPTPPPLAEPVHKDTVYITVVDRDRMKVSLIYSIFSSFGSGLASETFGILLHNRGAGFNLTPGHANEAGPGKRPLHTIIPGMLAKDGAITTPFGVMGGAYQATGHAHFMGNLLDYGMDLQTAIDAPRAFTTEGDLRLERGYAPGVATALSEKGHRVVTPQTPIGGAQAIRVDHDRGVLEGASDPRKDGCALGY